MTEFQSAWSGCGTAAHEWQKRVLRDRLRTFCTHAVEPAQGAPRVSSIEEPTHAGYVNNAARRRDISKTDIRACRRDYHLLKGDPGAL